MESLTNLRLKALLVTILVPLSLLALTLGLIASTQIFQIDAVYSDLITTNSKMVNNLTNARAMTTRVALTIYKELSEIDPSEVARLDGQIDQTVDTYKALMAESILLEPESAEEIKELRNRFLDFLTRLASVRQSAKENNSSHALALMKAGLDSELFELRQKHDDLCTKATQKIGQISSEITQQSMRTFWLIWTGLVLGLTASILLSNRIGQRVLVGRLETLRDSIVAEANGQNSSGIPFSDVPNEIGEISRSVAVLSRAFRDIQAQRWTKTHLSEITAIMQSATSAVELATKLLAHVAPILGVGRGAFYLVDEDGVARLIGTFAHRERKSLEQSFRVGEGLVGQCMLEKSAIIISQPPPGYLEISSGLGGAAPNAIIVLPIQHLGKVSGVVEFASFRAFSDSEQTLLDELVPIIATNLEILDRTQRTERLLIETREQAQRMEKQAALLEEQQVEMEAQQSELKATEAWFRGIIEAAPDGMLVVDDSGKIVLTNPRLEELFGYEPGELIGSPIEKLVPDVARSIHVGLRDEFLNSREPSRHEMGALGRELRGRKIDGTEFPLEVGLARLPSLHGRGTCVCAAVRDITQRKEAERLILLAKEAAEAATSAKSNFLAMMSHEIRTPMNGVMAMAEMLDQTDLSPDQRSMSSVIRGSADSLMTILNDILDFSKIEAGKLELESIPFDLGDTIEEAAELVASRADEKNLELIVSIDPNLPATIFGDPTRIRQILLNFLSNAIKFTESGSVQLAVAAGDISIDRQSGEFIVEVSDTGIGMNETQVAKMFQAFSQADTSTSRRFGGTGLGLSICQRLAEMMGGTVGVKSSVGAGSTFWFKLPARISDPQPAHPVVDISDAKVLAMGFSIRNRKALEGILRTARITDIVWEADPTSTLGELEKIDSKAIPIVFLAGDPTRAIQASRQITRGRSNVRAVVAAPRALASTLIAAPEAGAFDAVTMPLRRRRVWLSIAAALDRASLAASGNDAQSALERFYPPEKDEALAAKAVVLVAEDNMTNQHVIKRVLDRAGYFSIFADDGQFALEAFVKEPGIGLLLTDYHMPRMDGLELTRAIREKEKTDGGRLPIIMLTADALPETGHAVAEAGGDGYLTKPVKYALVRDALEQWLPAGASLRQLSPQKRDDKGTTEAKISKAASAETEPTIIDPASVEPIVDLSVLTDLIGEADVAQISEALELFWESVQSGPDEIASALVSKNYKALREVAHSLKGAAASVGAKAVAADLAVLEMAAKEENLERAQSIIDPIRSGFMAIQTFVNAYTGRA